MRNFKIHDQVQDDNRREKFGEVVKFPLNYTYEDKDVMYVRFGDLNFHYTADGVDIGAYGKPTLFHRGRKLYTLRNESNRKDWTLSLAEVVEALQVYRDEAIECEEYPSGKRCIFPTGGETFLFITFDAQELQDAYESIHDEADDWVEMFDEAQEFITVEYRNTFTEEVHFIQPPEVKI